MTGALFVSDLHLDSTRPLATRAFCRLLREEARTAGQIYILGDLFEFWIGDDDRDPLASQVTAALADYTAAGHGCAIMRGNRDFLLGTDFAARTGVRLIPDPCVVEICGEKVLLSHGDRLCTDDVAYQRHRRRVGNRMVQRIFLALPQSWRRAIATEGRRRSQLHTGNTPAQIMDVNGDAVRGALRSAGLHILVHGHTHRPAIHRFDLDGTPATRIVLGAWYEQASLLRWSPSGFDLSQRPFD